MSIHRPWPPQLLSLLEDYRDLSPIRSSVKIMHSPPDALSGLRMVQRGEPVIIRGLNPIAPESYRSHLPPFDPSSPESLIEALEHRSASSSSFSSQINPIGQINRKGKEREIAIAITDDGLADSVRYDIEEKDDVGVTEGNDEARRGSVADGLKETKKDKGKGYFVEPLVENMTPRAFFNKLLNPNSKEIFYLQSQNGNIYPSRSTSVPYPETDLAPLQHYIDPFITELAEVLGWRPDAVNLWVGGRGSKSSLHRDPYENLYCVLSGTKIFTLLSPIEGFFLDPQFFPTATLHRSPLDPHRLVPIPDDPKTSHPVPWVTFDPTRQPLPSHFPAGFKPLRVRVEEGETLFLPAGWWHYVEQEEGEGGICVAVNYWYDQTIDPARYALERFVWRQMGRQDMVD